MCVTYHNIAIHESPIYFLANGGRRMAINGKDCIFHSYFLVVNSSITYIQGGQIPRDGLTSGEKKLSRNGFLYVFPCIL